MLAARIARIFGLDPVAVLDEDDDWRWAVRVAAAEVATKDRKKEQDVTR